MDKCAGPSVNRVKEAFGYVSLKTIEWVLIFIIVVVPVLINPLAFDYWYRPKIESIYALIIIGAVAWFIKAVIDRSFRLARTILTIPLLCFISSAAISTLTSINLKRSLLGDPLRMEGLCTWVAYLFLVVLFYNQVRTKDLARRLIYGLILGATLVAGYGLLQYFGWNTTEHFFYKYWRRGPGVGSTMGNPNFLGKYLVLVLPIIFCQCLNHDEKKSGVFFRLALLTCFAALITTFTRASWLGAMVGLGALLIAGFRYSSLRGKSLHIMMLIVMLSLVVLFLNSYAPKITENEEPSFKQKKRGDLVKRTLSSFEVSDARGVATRLYVWKRTLHFIKERPWFGYGLETFEIMFARYNKEYSELFNDFIIVDRAHNNYLDIAFSLGMVGLLAYLSIMIVFLKQLLRFLREARNSFFSFLYLGMFSGYCGYLVNDFFIFSAVSVSPIFWSLMGFTLAIRRLEFPDV